MALNIMMKKELALEREGSKYQCNGCERHYFKNDILHKAEGIDYKGNLPSDGVCVDVFFYLIKIVWFT